MQHPSLLLTSLLFLSAGCMVGNDYGPGDLGPDDESSDVGDDGQGEGNGDDKDDISPPASGTAFVLAHGFGGSADSFAPEILEGLRAQGHTVVAATVPGVASVKNRATALGPQIDAVIRDAGVAKVHIIAHSMGGLDARYMMSQLGYADRVASLTTLSTPHRGSPLADVALGLDGDARDAAIALFEALAGEVDQAELEAALYDLSEAAAPAFNAANLDQPGVYYQSFAGFSTVFGVDNDDAPSACAAQPVVAVPDPDVMRAAFVLAAPIVSNAPDIQAHDGVVPVRSSTYGAFRGCIAADHIDETTAVLSEDEPFDVVGLYTGIASELAAP